MKILILTQVFWPENFKINELCSELVNKGHSVTVLTGKPNYPKGRFYKGYGLFSKIKSDYKGATIYRIPIIPRLNASGIMLSLNYLSFSFIGSLFTIFHFKKYDCSFVFAVSPLTSAIPAIIHKFFYGTKLNLWILDLWPEGVEVTGKLKGNFFKKQLNSLVKFIYKNSDKIYISSQYMRESISTKIPQNKVIPIEYLPNWADDYFFSEKIDRDKYVKLIPNGFKIMFAGNIGTAQDLPAIIKTAQNLKSFNEIKFIILGDGSEKDYLLSKIEELNLKDVIYYLGSYPIEEMPHFYCHADIMMLTLTDDPTYSTTVPGKLQSYFASKKPIAAMINGESADIIKQTGAGIVVDAGDYISFSKAIKDMSNRTKEDLEDMGIKGFDYYMNTFTKDKVISSLLNSICIENINNLQ